MRNQPKISSVVAAFLLSAALAGCNSSSSNSNESNIGNKALATPQSVIVPEPNNDIVIPATNFEETVVASSQVQGNIHTTTNNNSSTIQPKILKNLDLHVKNNKITVDNDSITINAIIGHEYQVFKNHEAVSEICNAKSNKCEIKLTDEFIANENDILTIKDLTNNESMEIKVEAGLGFIQPMINIVTAGDREITGKATPRLRIGWQETQYSKTFTNVDKNGNYKFEVKEHLELTIGQKISIYNEDGEELASTIVIAPGDAKKIDSNAQLDILLDKEPSNDDKTISGQITGKDLNKIKLSVRINNGYAQDEEPEEDEETLNNKYIDFDKDGKFSYELFMEKDNKKHPYTLKNGDVLTFFIEEVNSQNNAYRIARTQMVRIGGYVADHSNNGHGGHGGHEMSDDNFQKPDPELKMYDVRPDGKLTWESPKAGHDIIKINTEKKDTKIGIEITRGNGEIIAQTNGQEKPDNNGYINFKLPNDIKMENGFIVKAAEYANIDVALPTGEDHASDKNYEFTKIDIKEIRIGAKYNIQYLDNINNTMEIEKISAGDKEIKGKVNNHRSGSKIVLKQGNEIIGEAKTSRDGSFTISKTLDSKELSLKNHDNLIIEMHIIDYNLPSGFRPYVSQEIMVGHDIPKNIKKITQKDIDGTFTEGNNVKEVNLIVPGQSTNTSDNNIEIASDYDLDNAFEIKNGMGPKTNEIIGKTKFVFDAQKGESYYWFIGGLEGDSTYAEGDLFADQHGKILIISPSALIEGSRIAIKKGNGKTGDTVIVLEAGEPIVENPTTISEEKEVELIAKEGPVDAYSAIPTKGLIGATKITFKGQAAGEEMYFKTSIGGEPNFDDKVVDSDGIFRLNFAQPLAIDDTIFIGTSNNDALIYVKVAE